jgi:hypothetical protein
MMLGTHTCGLGIIGSNGIDQCNGNITKCKIGNWEQKSKNREDWMRSVKEAKSHTGL